MHPVAVLATLSLLVHADPSACPATSDPTHPQERMLAEFPDQPPRVPRGEWWYGARVPVAYQQHVYYPTWDTPLRILVGKPPMGTPAWEVPQRPAAPAYWRPLDW